MIATDLRFIRKREIVSRQVAGEVILVFQRQSSGGPDSLYTLNPVGSVLWEFLGQCHTLAEMVERVCEEFEVPKSQAEEDIRAFLGWLMKEKLIESVV